MLVRFGTYAGLSNTSQGNHVLNPSSEASDPERRAIETRRLPIAPSSSPEADLQEEVGVLVEPPQAGELVERQAQQMMVEEIEVLAPMLPPELGLKEKVVNMRVFGWQMKWVRRGSERR